MQATAFDLVLLTDRRYENPTQITPYIRNILTEDQLLQQALESLGLRVIRKDWASPDFDWSSTRYALFRTTWDYFDRFLEFVPWLDRVEMHTELINPSPLIRWNMDKRYLKDLEDKGIHICSTHFIEPGDTTSLKTLHETLGWQETVLKPAVSGGARHTYWLQPGNLAAHEAVFQELIQTKAMLLQPFQKNIMAKGEVSHMVFDGRYTHSVLKVAKAGDFRVQDDHGGTVHPYQASPLEIAYAEQVVAACNPSPIYARVDVVEDNQGNLALVELELIEPELWFRLHPMAAEALAQAIYKSYF